MTRKIFLLLATATLLLTSCKKHVDTFHFEGVARDYLDCTLMTASISERDNGYVIELITPDSIGGDYETTSHRQCHNCIILYHTRTLFTNGDTIRGEMYLDNDYSKAYCSYHYHLGLPEGVCYSLD